MSSRAEKLLQKGKGFEKKGRREQALQAYRDGCAKEPYDPDLWMARGEMAQTLKLTPEAVEAFFHVGELYLRGGMAVEALETVKRVLKLDPNHGGGKRLLRVLEGRAGTEESGPVAAKAAERAPEKAPEKAPERPPERAPEKAESVAVPVAVSDHVDVDESESEAEEIEITAEPPAPPPPPPPRAATEKVPPPMIPPAAAKAPPPPPAEAKAVPPAEAPPKRKPSAPAPAKAKGNGRAESVESHDALDSISLADHLTPRAGVNAGENAAEFTLDDDIKVDVVQMVASTLSSSPLLSELDSDLVRHLIDCGKLVHRNAGEAVFHEKDPGTSLYLILSGEVAVVREAHGAQPRSELARLRAGAFFGEMALLTNTPRSATVSAQKPSDFLEISRKSVRDLIDRDPRILKLLMRFFRARLVGTLLQTSPLFKPFAREDRRNLVPRFRLRELAADTTVLREGATTEGLFVVLVGKLDVTQSVRRSGSSESTAPNEVQLGTLAPGDVFGEMSLLDGGPAIASVKTRARSWVLLLRTNDYQEVAKQHPGLRDYLTQLAADRKEQNKAALTRYEPV